MVAQWSSHVRTMDVWGDEDFLEPRFFDVLATLDRLRAFRHVLPGGHLPLLPTADL